MVFSVQKQLRVTYSAPVYHCLRRLRVLPPQTMQESWRTVPEPEETREYFDDFGNRVLEVRHNKIEREFLFELSFTAALTSSCNRNLQAAKDVSSAVRNETGLGAFLLPSALCDLNEEIRQNAACFQRANSGIGMQICKWVHNTLRYDTDVSGIDTRASQSLLRGAGVCQDYAHLMIALCRACALPARYVSGYMPGEGRMHAWVEVLIKNEWQGFDPTHNRAVKNHCLPVAKGRDFRDCNPHQGTFRGQSTAKLESACRVKIEDKNSDA